MSSLTTQITGFVQNVVNAMGVTLSINVEETSDGTHINLEGEDGGILVRRGGEGLQALQHIVATTFRKQLGEDNRIVIDCNGFRKDKDAELRQMAHFMVEKARSSGVRRSSIAVAMSRADAPLIRTTPMPPRPGGVAIATMGSSVENIG